MQWHVVSIVPRGGEVAGVAGCNKTTTVPYEKICTQLYLWLNNIQSDQFSFWSASLYFPDVLVHYIHERTWYYFRTFIDTVYCFVFSIVKTMYEQLIFTNTTIFTPLHIKTTLVGRVYVISEAFSPGAIRLLPVLYCKSRLCNAVRCSISWSPPCMQCGARVCSQQRPVQDSTDRS